MAAKKKKKTQESISENASNENITALYIRVSTDFQSEEGYSLEAQEKKLKQWCELKDYTNYQVYQDGGWSGSNLDRPAMKKLIADIINKRVKRVVVYKLDRLSRSQKDTLFLLEELFIPNQVEFYSMNENFDTSTPYGKAMIGILSVFAQLERENIRERTRMGMYERVKEGFWRGGSGTPFGYNYDSSQDILVPNENAEDVRSIYDLYLKGYSTTQLAKMFPVANDRHITNILDRITYTGKISYNGEIFQGRHEAIIDENTWQKVQIERKRRSTKNIVTSHYLLTGLMVCGKCGAKMHYQRWSGGRTKIICYSQQTSKPNLVKDPNCENMRCESEDLEKLVINDLFDLSKTIMAADTALVDTRNDRTAGLKVLQQKYDIISSKIKRLYKLYAESGDKLLLSTIQDNQQELSSVSKALESEKSSVAVVNDVVSLNNAVKNIQNGWENMTIAEKHRILRTCIDKIIITDNAVDIKYLI